MFRNRLQIETTTRCTLRCPACSRTWWRETLGKKIPIQDIDIDLVFKFLDCESGKKIEYLDIRGDWGDCIYYPKLGQFIDRFRNEKKFIIVTNGANQTKKFWQNLSARLTEEDTVEFSIDGLEDTNHLYRKNSNWQSIMTGLDIIKKGKAKVVWMTRIFSFNQNIIPKMKKFAEDKGATFVSETTHRFGDESLKPTEDLIDSKLTYDPKRIVTQIKPKCKVMNNSSISAFNMFMPCSWFCAPQVLYKSDLWKNREAWMIKDTTLDILIKDVLLPWAENIEKNPLSASILCKTKCRKELQI